MTADKKALYVEKRGIDLFGRMMHFAPWHVDSNWKFLPPVPDSIDKTYGISGEAVKETLLYFEERAAVELNDSTATARLVKLLNRHITNPRYIVSREILLDPSRYYTNEFYFYFIMFTKKIMGRYDFHFGEGSDDQLSIYHKTYEKGLLQGVLSTDEKRNKLKHISTLTISTVSDYLKNDRIEEEIKNWLCMLLPEEEYKKYLLARTKYFSWFRLELVSAIMDFYAILSNRNNIIFDSSHETVAELVKGSQIIQEFHGSRPYAALGRIILLSVNQLYGKDGVISSLISRSNTQLRITFKANLEVCAPYKKYFKAVQNQICMFYRGGGTSMPIHANISPFYAEINDHSCIRNDDAVCDHEFFWPGAENRRSSIFLTLLTAANCVLLVLIYFYLNFISSYIILFLINLVVLLFSRSLKDKKRIAKMILDIRSQRQSLETQNRCLEELNLDLENKVVERTNELYEANKRLTELDRLKTQFFSNISHELRTPLTLLLTPLEAMARDVLPADREHLELMYRNSTRLLQLINTLLDFSKIEEGRLNLARKNINLSRLVSESLISIDSTARLRGITLRSDITEDLFAFIDCSFFEKAFFNLLSNALKFTPQGGEIAVTLIQNDETLFLEVIDTGIGIPADKIGGIFDRFSQADGSSSRKFEGTGIGLAFAKEIIELHGGSISVSSIEGEGSVFTIELTGTDPDGEFRETPLPDSRPAAVKEEKAEKVPLTALPEDRPDLPGAFPENNIDIPPEKEDPGQGSKQERPIILIVEDNSDMRTLLRTLLYKDYTLVEAENGQDALKKTADPETMPDIILADVMMPQMDGYELAREIRNNKDMEGIPVILLTAKAEKENFLEGFESGAVDYIIKPFHGEELKSRIKAQLNMKLLRDRLKRSNVLLYKKLEKLLEQNKQNCAVQDSGNKDGDVSKELLSKINHVDAFICENFTHDLSRDQIASICQMSPDYLSKTFQSVKGIKLFDYLRDLRLEHAAEMLKKTGNSVISIAYASGFDNIRTFNRQFQKKFGTNPLAYRERTG